jgi:hypothetical protein
VQKFYITLTTDKTIDDDGRMVMDEFFIHYSTNDIIYKSFMLVLYLYIKFKIISTRIKKKFEKTNRYPTTSCSGYNYGR